MINYNKELVSALNKILPTHYEMALTSKTNTPCISYMELNNYTTTEPIGATVGYSRITYQVKLWGKVIEYEALQEYVLEIDKTLREIGFKRIASGELYDNQNIMVQKILTYEALALENY